MDDGERADPAPMTTVATREHRRTRTTISAKRAIVISVMIDNIAATAAEGRLIACRRKHCMTSTGGYKQEGCRLIQGEHGVVVRARHRSTGHRSGRSQASDALREACFTAAGSGHPSLSTFRTVACSPGTMDYSIITNYAGPTLRAVMGDHGGDQPFLESEVHRHMRQLLASAEVMHGHNIVHQDIKPENILVGGDQSMIEKDTPCCFTGTMPYMAPEVLAKNTDHGALVDASSLGCVMAELLTSKPPFAGKDEAHQLFKNFDVLSVPCRRAWQAMKPQAYEEEVQVWRAWQLRARHRNRLCELFPEKMLSRDRFRVLKGLLTCDPKKQLMAATALQCLWFTKDDDDDAPISETERITVTNIAGMASKFSSLALSFALARQRHAGSRLLAMSGRAGHGDPCLCQRPSRAPLAPPLAGQPGAAPPLEA
ncbi:LOW QUALITY PROTEIN: hypothetical protein SETIT_7G028000v2 [Setaria italica]|uniref:[RNA-polymerase]-subunit kinase n=1 Tax=Setaria italica TaxID=4555 RepID=A0A368RRN3_SETIT|nr:LOW QUALITY PROTEIN: hypothetical protein SETIT_7G028000v2 [Setaria italica]